MARKPKDKSKHSTKREAALEAERQRDKELREKYFMGRRDILERFKELLSTPYGERKVWSIYGIGGIGKSWLLAELEDGAKENRYRTSYVNLENCKDHSSLFIAIWEQVTGEDPSPFPESSRNIARLHRILTERNETREIPLGEVWKTVLVNLGKQIPKIGGFYGDVKGDLEDRSKEYDDNFLKQFPQIMKASLLEDIEANLEKKSSGCVLFLDTYERCPLNVMEAVKALMEEYQGSAVIVIAGRESLLEKHLPRGEGWEAVIEEEELPDLEIGDIREWLKTGAAASVKADTNARRIKYATAGFPLLVTFVLETLGKEGLEELPSISLGMEITGKERQEEFFRKRILGVLEKLDADDASSLKIAAFPRRFNGTLFSTLFEKLETGRGSLEVRKFFKKVKEYSFVRSEDEWFHCHTVLQDAVRFDWLEENKKLWETMHKVCSCYFDNEDGLDAFLEKNFHDYQLRPFESWQEFTATYSEWSADEGKRPIADAMLEDFSSYCAHTGVGISDEELFQVFDGVDTLLFEYPRGDRAALCLRRIDLLEAAKAIVTDRVREASLNNSLGNTWWALPTGDRAENIEKAIRYYELALKVFTNEALPEQWATTQNNLGTAYSDRIRGERAENIERAIEHYTLALEVRTREVFPEQWAVTQNNLGAAYNDRIRGERAENIESAIEHYTMALEVRTREAYTAEWARTQNNLGEAYRNRIRGERADNIENAIEHFKLALEVRTREAFPAGWATTQNNLGTAYVDRIRGERAENIESAIEHYELALEVYTREAFPADWAMTQNNLGAAYSSRISGDRAENIEKAIEHYTLALEEYTREAFPADWAMTQNNLGTSFSNRIRGERAENIESAIEHYTIALEVRTREGLPIDFGETKHNLALVYLEDDFPFPEKERLEIALGHLEEACEVLDPDYQVHRIAFKKRDEVKARLRELEEEGE